MVRYEVCDSLKDVFGLVENPIVGEAKDKVAILFKSLIARKVSLPLRWFQVDCPINLND
jgi:hypothetical protein